jgi:Mg-chelatase subunit ChlD
MVDPGYTAVLFIVDRSGSMATIAGDMEGGIRTFLDDQRKLPGKLTIDSVLFDTTVDYVDSFADPADVDLKIHPRGSTALHDAVGIGVAKFGAKLAALPEGERPATVIVVIVTDGQENASHEYRAEQVADVIKHQTEAYGWNFVYLGANQNAVTVARGMGIPAHSAMTYAASHAGTQSMAAAASSYTTNLRTTGKAAFTEQDRQDANR